jgi:transketolase
MDYNEYMLTEKQVDSIELKAVEIRKDIIKMLLEAGSGHSAGPLGMADVFSTLYFSGVLNWNPDDPWNEDRDRVYLSNGHICPVWYATLAHTGAFSHEELWGLRKLGSRLQGHPHFRELPGVENSAGPLGQGISQAVGAAMAFRMSKVRNRVYCLMSDGEFQEGQVWEALMFAGKYKLHNLALIVDRNNIQIDGYTEDVMPLEPFATKLKAFNIEVMEIDGHNVSEIYGALEKSKAVFERPTVIVAHTIPGKGVDFMEGEYSWHGKVPKPGEGIEALTQLRTLWGKISAD